MAKINKLNRKKYLEILKNELISEIKNEETVDFLILSISSRVHDLVPSCSTEWLFKESIRKIIIFWKTNFKDQDIEKLELFLIRLFVKKTSNKFFEFTNKNPGLLLIISVISLIVSIVFPTLNIIFC